MARDTVILTSPLRKEVETVDQVSLHGVMMAQHFQPNPPYGSSPYQPGPYYPMYQQFPSQQQAPTPSFPHQQQQVRQPGPYQHSPSFNLGRFESNSQATTPNQNAPFTAPHFNTEMLKQLANSSMPLPPPPNFPPVPIPNLNFPHFPQTTAPPQSIHPQQYAAGSTSTGPPDDYDPRYPNQLLYSSKPEPSHSAVAPVNNVTEGLRRDGGSASSKTVSQEDYQHDYVVPAGKSQNTLNLDGSVFSAFARPTEQYPQHLRDTWYGNTSNLNVSEASQRHQMDLGQPPALSARQSSFHPPSVPDHALMPDASTAAPAPEASSALPASQADTRSLPKLRDSAKAALLSLAPHSISFAEIVKEGIDASLLQKLYAELGVNVDESPSNNQHDPVPAAQVTSQPVDSTASVAEPQDTLTVPTAESSESRATRPQPAVSPSIERKDRIAQLLAAKTGRPSPVRTLSESVASTGASDARPREEQTVVSEVVSRVFPPPNHVSLNPVPTTESGSLHIQQYQKHDPKLDDENLTGAPPRSLDSPSLHVSTQRAHQEAVQASPLSAIPGLFMISSDPTQSGGSLMQSLQALAEDSDTTRTTQKRSFEPDAQQDFERNSKRRNTDTTGVDMDIDDSTDDNDASEGEVPDAEINQKKQSQEPRANGVPSSHPPTANIEEAIVTSSTSRVATGSQPNASVTPSKTRLTSAQIAEKAEMLKARFLKQRAERQKTLQEGLPDLEAEVQRTRSRLAKHQAQLVEVRQQIDRLDREASEARDAEKTLLEDIGRLEKQLREGVSGQTKYADELHQLNDDQNMVGSKAAPLVEGIEGNNDQRQGPVRTKIGEMQEALKEVPDVLVDEEALRRSDSQASMKLDSEIATGTFEEAETAADATLDQDVTELATNGHETYGDVVSEVDETHSASDQIERYADEDLDYKSDGSASMSDSGSEIGRDAMEYEPVEADPSHPMDNGPSDDEEYDPESVEVDNSPRDDLVEQYADDEYEPEAVRPQNAGQTSSALGEGHVLDSPSAAVELPATLTLPEASDDPFTPGHDANKTHAETTGYSASLKDTEIAHSEPSNPAQEEESRPTAVESTKQAALTNSAPTNGTSIGYVPYQSPLSSFQSFRYHEQFQKEPPKDGYRSLTYSHNIDPSVPLCLTELAGGVCQDAQCQEQHFRHLGLTGMDNLLS